MLAILMSCLFLIALVCPYPLAGEAPSPVPAESAQPDYPIDIPLGGKNSSATDTLLRLLKSWPNGRNFCHFEKQPLDIHMVRISTAERPYYVGFKKCMSIHAPVSAVSGVLDGVEHYEQLFPGDKRVKVLARDRNKVTLGWERKIPVLFVPNVEYQMNYLSVSPGTGIKMYRSQLKQGDRLLFSDAIVVIESTGPETTLYSDYEFYEADYGVGLFGINAVGADTVWKESLRGSYLSLLAIRFKAEHLDWDYEHIAKASELALQSIDLDKSANSNFLELGSLGKD